MAAGMQQIVKKKWRIVGVFVVLCLVLLGLVVAIYQQTQLVLAVNYTAWQEDHSADCAIVLTGGPGRVREGFDLLARGAVRKLVVAGVNPQAKLREIFPRWPYYENLVTTNVILEKRSRTTYGNAQQTLTLIEALHCRDVILITSRLHMYRAKRTFQAIFPKDFPIFYRAIVMGDYQPHWTNVLVEGVKSLFYAVWVY